MVVGYAVFRDLWRPEPTPGEGIRPPLSGLLGVDRARATGPFAGRFWETMDDWEPKQPPPTPPILPAGAKPTNRANLGKAFVVGFIASVLMAVTLSVLNVASGGRGAISLATLAVVTWLVYINLQGPID